MNIENCELMSAENCHSKHAASISLKSVMFAYFSKILSPKFNPGPNFNCFSLSPTGCNWFLFVPWATKSVFCVVSSPNS